jgi:hypothetical protein
MVAPMVWAKVLRISMAEMGRWMFSLKSVQVRARPGRFWDISAMSVVDMLSNEDSRIEHRKEKKSAIETANTKMNMSDMGTPVDNSLPII